MPIELFVDEEFFIFCSSFYLQSIHVRMFDKQNLIPSTESHHKINLWEIFSSCFFFSNMNRKWNKSTTLSLLATQFIYTNTYGKIKQENLRKKYEKYPILIRISTQFDRAAYKNCVFWLSCLQSITINLHAFKCDWREKMARSGGPGEAGLKQRN